MTLGNCFLENAFRTVAVKLRKSENPVLIISKLQKLFVKFVSTKSIVLGVLGLLK